MVDTITFGPPTAEFAPEEPLFDEALLATLRRLALVSRRVATSGLAGEHRSRRRGASPEFADFKRYSQGDDFRSIDWNIYSRLDALFVRLSEITTELMVHILIDSSASMNWRESDQTRTKFGYARQLGGAFAYLGLWHFDRVFIAPVGSSRLETYGPAQGRAHLLPMLQYLERMEASGDSDWLGYIQRYVQSHKRPGIMIIFSDLLSVDPEQLQVGLRLLRSHGWQTTVIQTFDAWEVDPALNNSEERGSLLFVDSETGHELELAMDDAVIARYRTVFDSWRSAIEQTCSDEDAWYLQVNTNWPLETIVLRTLQYRGILE